MLGHDLNFLSTLFDKQPNLVIYINYLPTISVSRALVPIKLFLAYQVHS
ncbi:hypothetical protein FPOG_01930 [Fusobacterium periodonticum D10]|uniref:Uncharacterized protein n=1 Tax=Fusobacterium periodonticum D10 TaxID=620833 RepID=K1GNA5_9FUSO|nr:hypothetical protein FPOG_01930 [Fusobacterium periodonticum D10]